MRCPDCNKFVPFDSESDPEIDLDISDRVVTGSVRITNNCEDCGQELKEATFDVDEDFNDVIEDHWKAHGWKGGKAKPPEGHREFDVSDDGGSRTDEYQTTDRNGKKIKNYRYMKHLYGATVTIAVTCECGETFEREWSDNIPGSGMDELV